MTSRSLENAFTGTPYEPGSDGAKPLQTVTADVFLRKPPPQRRWLPHPLPAGHPYPRSSLP